MIKKLILLLVLLTGFSNPVMAEQFPDNGLMQANTTYENAANATNMDGVYENGASVNALANYNNLAYNITYVSKYESNEIEDNATNPTSYISTDLPITLNNPTHDDYIFVGWCTDAELTNCSLKQTIAADTTGDKTFYAHWEPAKFTLTTSATNSFQFSMTATGTFYVDCGDDGVLSIETTKADCGNGNIQIESSSTISGKTIIRTTINEYELFKCSYGNSGGRTIKFGGRATGYSTQTGTSSMALSNDTILGCSTIRFESPAKITGIYGTLGAIFGTVSNPVIGQLQPRFISTFMNATNLQGKIPDDLFKGVSGSPTKKMFDTTFSGCANLTGPIPEGLFAGIHGYASSGEDMFFNTFNGCTNLNGVVPEKLFCQNPDNPTYANCIIGAPASGMFAGTFYGCENLGVDPDNSNNEMNNVLPARLFAGLSGTVSSSSRGQFVQMFYGCDNLTKIRIEDTITEYIPANFLNKITGRPEMPMASGMFAGTGLSPTCPAGMYDSTPGYFAGADRPWCSPCAAGSYTDTANNETSCKLCPAGTYVSEIGATSCVQCPAAYPDSVEGESDANRCFVQCTLGNSGTLAYNAKEMSGVIYSDGTNACTIKECQPRYYLDNGVPNLMSIIGTTRVADAVSSSSTSNASGSFIVDFGALGKINGESKLEGVADPLTLYNNYIPGAKFYCKLTGYTSPDGTKYSFDSGWIDFGTAYASSGWPADGSYQCAARGFGRMDNYSNDLRATAFSRLGYRAPSCMPCPSGTYFDSETNSCVACPAGTYNSSTGALSCTPCSETFPEYPYSAEGATSKNMCYRDCVAADIDEEGVSAASGIVYSNGTKTCEITECGGDYRYKKPEINLIDAIVTPMGGNYARNRTSSGQNWTVDFGTYGIVYGTSRGNCECSVTKYKDADGVEYKLSSDWKSAAYSCYNCSCAENCAYGLATDYGGFRQTLFETVKTASVCETCSPGSYLESDGVTCTICPENTFSTTNNAPQCQQCPPEYPYSDAGATQCYRDCVPADVVGASDVTGTFFQDGTNNCKVTACADGYSYYQLGNPAKSVSFSRNVFAYTDSNGLFYEGYTYDNGNKPQSYYEIYEPNSWAIDFEDKGIAIGSARCSNVPGDISAPYANTELGANEGQYCYCAITKYKDTNGNIQNMTSPWFYLEDAYYMHSNRDNDCSSYCSYDCGSYLSGNYFGNWSIIADGVETPVMCVGKTINIDWAGTDDNDVENGANMCTFGGAVKAPHAASLLNIPKGKRFVGWRVKKKD